MLNIDFESKRSKAVLTFLKYGLSTIVVILMTVLLVFVANGYDIDRETGEVIQNGIILVDSEPVSAELFVNGEPENDKTRSKLALPEGQYEILLREPGYHEWSKKVNLDALGVVWMSYIRLIPEEIKVSNVQVFKAVDMASVSEGGKRLLVHEVGAGSKFLLVDIENSQATPETFEIPEDVLELDEDNPGTFSVIEWAKNNRRVLLEHKVDNQLSHLVIDVDKPENSENITADFGLELTSPVLADGNDRVLYALVDSTLHMIDLNAKTVSSALARSVDKFVYDQDLVAIINTIEEDVVLNLLHDDKTTAFTKLGQSADNYLFDTAVFDGERYLVLADKSAGQTSIYKEPVNQAESEDELHDEAVLRLANVEHLSFSPHSQFILVQSGGDFRLYDIDDQAKKAFSTTEDLASGEEATWIDGYHLNLINKSGASYFMDYDGSNVHKINDVDRTYGVFYDSDSENMLSLTQGTTGNHILQVSALVAE